VHAGAAHLDIAQGSHLQRLIPFQHGAGLLQGSLGLVQRGGGNEALALQFGEPAPVALPLFQLGLVNEQRAACRLQVLEGQLALALLDAEARFGDDDLLAIIGVIDHGQHRALAHPLPLIEWQGDDARLHGLKAQHAFVGFDISRQQQHSCSRWCAPE
jgi:hypothetical protein